MTTVQDKVFIVTGAASGMGYAAAQRLIQEEAKVALLDINEDRLKEAEEQLQGEANRTLALTTDLSSPEEVKKSIDMVQEHWDRIDGLFANAGVNGKVMPIEDMPPEEWDHTIETNLKGSFLTLKYAIPHMKEKGGSVVLTSSINGNRTFTGKGFSAYSSSKAGIMAFGKMAALELASQGIRVNIICPGFIDTNIGENTRPSEQKLEKIDIPVKKEVEGSPLNEEIGSPEQVADLVHFLLSDASSHITGTEVFIDGAESLL
ncbi:SDR family NAD(P)-dependent oxidoreductase [Halobacillus sp. K22]|uniref:SDR family NAD(P)-dependent oxidoreductase n=1 Tax=Halobacillus sp. K22 TaxID=3457431 RepID=UPI003FCE964A